MKALMCHIGPVKLPGQFFPNGSVAKQCWFELTLFNSCVFMCIHVNGINSVSSLKC